MDAGAAATADDAGARAGGAAAAVDGAGVGFGDDAAPAAGAAAPSSSQPSESAAPVAAAAVLSGSGSRASLLLTKLSKQQLRLKFTSTAFTKRLTAPAHADQQLAVGARGGTSQRALQAPSSRSLAASHDAGGLRSALDALGGGGPSGARRGVEDSDADMERLASGGLTNAAIVDVLVGVREEFGGAAAAANEGAAFSVSGGGGAAGGGASKGSGATNDLFASPAFAAGRVFCLNTNDSVVLEAHFSQFVPSVLKQLSRAARRQRFVAIPMTEAIVMAQLAATRQQELQQRRRWRRGGGSGPGGVAPLSDAWTASNSPHLLAAIDSHRDAYLSTLATQILTAARGGSGAATAAAAVDATADAPHGHRRGRGGSVHSNEGRDGGHGDDDGGGPPPAPVSIETYGELFEALLRGWDMLPLGLYRRVHPATGLRASGATVAALQLAAGPPTPNEDAAHNRALVSYVYTNPPRGSPLSEHDLVYALRPGAGGQEEDEGDYE